MGKVEICSFFLPQWRYLDFFLQKCLLSSPLYVSYNFVQIGVFDWLSGGKKGSNCKNVLKSSSQETIWRMKPKLGILA